MRPPGNDRCVSTSGSEPLCMNGARCAVSAARRSDCVSGLGIVGSSLLCRYPRCLRHRLDVQEFTGPSVIRCPRPRWRSARSTRPRPAAGRVRRAVRQGPRSWRAIGSGPTNSQGDDVRRLLPHRRHRRYAAGWVAEVVDRIKDMSWCWASRLSERIEEVLACPSGRAGGGGDRRARRALGRDGRRLHREEGRQPERGRPARLLARTASPATRSAPGRLP